MLPDNEFRPPSIIFNDRLWPAWLQPHVIAVIDRLPRLAGGKADRAACDRILHERGANTIRVG